MAKSTHTSAAYTTEFHHEFRAETGRLLRKRFLWFTAVAGTFGVAWLIAGVGSTLGTTPGEVAVEPRTIDVILEKGKWVLWFAWFALYAGAFWHAWREKPRDAVLIRLSFLVVMVGGLLNVAIKAVTESSGIGAGGFFATHFLACLLLPWTPWQALRPMIIVLLVNVPVTLIVAFLALADEYAESGGIPDGIFPQGNTIAALAFSPLLAVPGTFWCWVRHSKRTQDFKYRFISTRYTEMRRELVDARKIHESLFPDPIDIGHLRFAFEYEPMRQIGGDFLFSHRATSDAAGGATDATVPLSIVLLDVTGHGIPAALTVNRLHGELERVFAEDPGVGPGEVLRLLNRYIHLTLSSHSIYVTALCFRVDVSASTLEYASGGHPPAFLRAVDGTVEELASTAFVLGACPDEAFDAAPKSLQFGPGDTMFAYTDGAIEARGESGTMIRIDGLRRMIASANHIHPTKWPAVFRDEVVDFRDGPAEDDTLLLVVHRVVGGAVSTAGQPVSGRVNAE